MSLATFTSSHFGPSRVPARAFTPYRGSGVTVRISRRGISVRRPASPSQPSSVTRPVITVELVRFNGSTVRTLDRHSLVARAIAAGTLVGALAIGVAGVSHADSAAAADAVAQTVASTSTSATVQVAPSFAAGYVVVKHSDSLWSIAAARTKPGADVRAQMDAIAGVNDLRGQQVFAGQVLRLPEVK